MKKQILLLLGLVSIGTLGLAAGIEASKGNWDYRSLVQVQRSSQSVSTTALTTLTTKPVSSSVPQKCSQDDSAPHSFVRFSLQQTKAREGVTDGQPTCTAGPGTEKTKGKKLALCLGCLEENATGIGRESPIDPQDLLPPTEQAPSHIETIRFIG